MSYISKEVQEGTIVGPVDKIDLQAFHCSPLMTCPKDDNKHLVIMDLSYPRGNSVNDFVNKLKFHGAEFTRHFPTIDDIACDIMACTDDPVLFKIDVTCTFCNLREDPANSLKFCINW